MSKIGVYSVYDMAVKAFMPPFYARQKGEAIRMFTSAVNDDKSVLSQYSHDYWLAYIGEFDDVAGLLEGVKNPERIIGATECKEDNVFPPDKQIPVDRRPM